MTDTPKKSRSNKRGKPRRTYVHRPNAVCITVHSMDGSPVPRSVLNEAAEAVTDIAIKNNCLINLAEV